MSKRKKPTKVIIEEDNKKDNHKNKDKKVIIKNNSKELTDIDKLNALLKSDLKKSFVYKDDCMKIYKLYIKIESSSPNLLTVYIKKKILSSIFDDITKDEYNYINKPYYLYKDQSKIPNDVQIMMEFDKNFFKYCVSLCGPLLKKLNDDIADLHRCIYIMDIILNVSTDIASYMDIDTSNLISHKTHRFDCDEYETLVDYLNVPEQLYDIDVDKILELCDKQDLGNLISYLCQVENQEQTKIINRAIEKCLKNEYNKNDKQLISLVYYDNMDNISTYSPVFEYLTTYTDCNDLFMIVNPNNQIDKFLDVVQNSLHGEQKINILYGLFNYRCLILEKTRKNSFEDSFNIDTHLDPNKFESLGTLIQIIRDNKLLMLEMFQLIFSKITPSLEYMHILMKIEDSDICRIGFRLMLNEGIMPTEETLKIACENLCCQDIYLIIERKVLPTTEHLISYISHNPSQEQIYYKNIENIDIDHALNLFFECGLQFSNELVEKCIEKGINIYYKNYGVEYTLDMYNLFGKYNRTMSDSNMEQFMSIPELEGIVNIKDAFKRRTWGSISKIGSQHKIIPDQECLNLACKSSYIDVPIKLLYGTNIISINKDYNKWRCEDVKNDAYLHFLLDKNIPIALTDQNIKDLQSRDRLECLGHISHSYVKLMEKIKVS